jgi:hypothetical protein
LLKNNLFIEFLNIHKRTKTLNFLKKQKQKTLNFSLASNFIFVYRTLSTWQKTQNHQNQGSIDIKIRFFSSRLHTQMGSFSAKKREQKIPMLGHL